MSNQSQAGDAQLLPFRSGHRHSTWAGTFRSFPEQYIQPTSTEQLRDVVRLAALERKRICVTGCGHSPSDLTCTSKILINLDRLDDGKCRVDEDHVVTLPAGTRLHDLNQWLKLRNLAMPNIGSIDQQSIGGAISTSTHGSSLSHGILSQNVLGLRLMLANGQVVTCSETQNLDLFRAALVSLGALGIIIEITFQAVEAFNIRWEQTLLPMSQILEDWDRDLWTAREYSRCWWMPYTKKVIRWRAEKTSEPVSPRERRGFGGRIGFHLYQVSLYLTTFFPSLLPTVEKFVHILHYGSQGDGVTSTGIANGHTGLLMDCLYSQYVNEWAIDLEKGPEAINRLSKWLNHEPGSDIPMDSTGIYVHAPIEVRVSDTSNYGPRPYLDFTYPDGPTLFLNATLYRPYHKDPPGWRKYYEAFEWLMKDLGGRPHWAKNFQTVTNADLHEMYPHLQDYLRIRQDLDPKGMFVGDWHRRLLLTGEALPLEECEISRSGEGGDVFWYGNNRRRAGHLYDGASSSGSEDDLEKIRMTVEDE